MKYTMAEPCQECPFLRKNAKSYGLRKLNMFASGEFACHKTCEIDDEEGVFNPKDNSLHCAGALIFLEKREQPHQMMRICERLGFYDRSKLKMDCAVA